MTTTTATAEAPAVAAADAATQQQVERLLALAGVKPAAPDASAAALPPKAPIADLAGAALPTYWFAADEAAEPPRAGGAAAAAVPSDGDAATTAAAGAELARGPGAREPGAPGRALLDGLLQALWDAAAAKGLFRYDVTACPTKVLPGSLGFVAQLNEGRATKKRPTEFKLDQVVQPFDASKFHFGKAAVEEVLFAFEAAGGGSGNGSSGSGGSGAAFAHAAKQGASPNAVLINVSPIDYGHALLCPRVLDRLPQLLDTASVLLALRFAREAGNPFLRVGYNSLGAYATINHLHFQCYYLNAPMPIERAPVAPLEGAAGVVASRPRADGVRVARIAEGGYPVRAFVLEAPADGRAGGLKALAAVAADAARALQAANVPHNMLIGACGSRIYLAPQCYAEKQAKGAVPEHLLATGVNPAVWEVTGHMIFFRAADYEGFTQERAWELLAEISLGEARFLEVAAMCFGDGVGSGSGAECAAAARHAAAAARGARCSECGAEAAAAAAAAAGEAAAAAEREAVVVQA